jgi:3-oxoacyl-(acyl-carrier-protein) synthase
MESAKLTFDEQARRPAPTPQYDNTKINTMSKSTFPRVLITGMGCVSPLGNDVPTFWNELINGKSGIDDLTKIDTTGLRNTQGGEVRDLRWSDYGEEGDCDEATQFAVAATHEAIADAQLTLADLENAGIAFSTNFGGAASWEAACEMAPQADKNCLNNSRWKTRRIMWPKNGKSTGRALH